MNSQVVIFAVIIALSQAEIFNRPCRTVEQYGGVVTPFRQEEYLKLWYEIERYEGIFQRNVDCSRANYTLNDDGSIRIENRGKDLSTLERTEGLGRAVLTFPNEVPIRGILNVTFAGQDGPYWILSTDYIQYAVVVSCNELPLNRSFENYWLLSRSPKLSPQARINADAIVARVLDKSRVRETVQDETRCL